MWAAFAVEFAGQAVHDAAAIPEKVLAGQSAQLALPPWEVYFPAAHGEQESAPALEYRPGGQRLQAAASASENDPALQAAHLTVPGLPA